MIAHLSYTGAGLYSHAMLPQIVFTIFKNDFIMTSCVSNIN